MLAVIVTFPFVHPFGFALNVVFAVVNPATVPVPLVAVACFVFPALSFTSTVIVWFVVCVKLSHFYVPIV